MTRGDTEQFQGLTNSKGVTFAHNEVTIEILQRVIQPESVDWKELASNGKTDLEVDDLEQALFLFAYHRVRQCPDVDFEVVCRANVPYWRKRIHPEAWPIVKRQIAHRCKTLGLTGAAPAEQQMRMDRGEKHV